MKRLGVALACIAMISFPAPLHAQDDVPAAPTPATVPATVPAFTPFDGSPQCRGVQGYAADFGGARTFLWRPRWITSVTSGAAREDVLQEAEAALSRGPYSVTDKPQPIPGAAANDYASIGPYWWPDPDQEDGLPMSAAMGK